MALATTTLSSAATATDKSIVVASATSVAAGRLIRVDNEVMQVVQSYVSGTTVGVLRGRDGTAAVAHVVTADVVHGTAADFAVPGFGSTVGYPEAGRSRRVRSYSATGAITLPSAGTDEVAILNGTVALAMTLADPTGDMDGTILYIVGNGKAAHTVTVTNGFGLGGAGYDVVTFEANGLQGIQAMAMKTGWVVLSTMTGTLTRVSPGIA